MDIGKQSPLKPQGGKQPLLHHSRQRLGIDLLGNQSQQDGIGIGVFNALPGAKPGLWAKLIASSSV